MSKFWDKVRECKHENVYDCYQPVVSCPTEYCGCYEYHCKDCGVYITECACGSSSGLSGWPAARHRKEEKKKCL